MLSFVMPWGIWMAIFGYQADLSVMAAGPVGAAVVYALVRLIALVIVIHGAAPSERPEILRALGDFFRWRRPPGDQGGGPTPPA